MSQQDESGQASAPITSQTANPTIELQRATTTQPPLTGTPPSVEGCVECFDILSNAQELAFVASLSDEGGVPRDNYTRRTVYVRDKCNRWDGSWNFGRPNPKYLK